MICSRCSTEFEGNYCPSCGQSTLSKKCPRCSTETTGAFCPTCGYSFAQPENAAPPPNYQAPPIIITNANTNNVSSGYTHGGISIKSKWIALILCLLFGMWGVHRFYVGKVGTGLIWLFSGGVFAIGWILDLIMIVSGGFTDSAGCFLKV